MTIIQTKEQKNKNRSRPGAHSDANPHEKVTAKKEFSFAVSGDTAPAIKIYKANSKKAMKPFKALINIT